MIRKLILKWLILAFAIALTAWLFPGIDVDGAGRILVVAAVFGVIDALIGPIIRLFTLPLIVLTLGLFTFVINALLLYLTEWLVDGFEIDGFLPALGGAAVITIVVVVLEWILEPSD